MKPETKRAMLAQPIEIQREIIALLAGAMEPMEFVAALQEEDGSYSDDGMKIFELMQPDDESRDAIEEEIQNEYTDHADRLHEAICEGRKQDAIDILNAILPAANLRSVSTQNSLFPHRVEMDF